MTPLAALLLLSAQVTSAEEKPGLPPAEAEAPAEPDPVWDVSAELTAVSDYHFRGVSLSDLDPAAQGAVSVTHRSGITVGVWASTIAQTAGGADVEVDLSASYAAQLGGIELDATAIYYLYPGDADLNYAEAILTAALPLGPVIPSFGLAYAPDQDALDEDNLYGFGKLEAPVPGTSLTVSATAGYEDGAFDLSDSGGKWDWGVGVSAEFEPVTLGLSYVDSDAVALDVQGRDNLAGAAVILQATLGL